MRILGISSVFHDPAAALVVDGEVVAATEEEHGVERELRALERARRRVTHGVVRPS